MWAWSNFSGFTIFEFINHEKVIFFSARTYPNFSHFPSHFPLLALRFDLALERDPRYIFYCQHEVDNYSDQVLNFYYMIDMSIYTWNLSVCNSGQYIYVTGLCNFFFVLQDLIGRINSYFQRIAFWRNLLLIGFKHSTSQVFSDENKQLALKWRSITFKEKLWWKDTGEYQISKSLFSKEGMILLCQSILETRQISHLHGSSFVFFSFDRFSHSLISFHPCIF